jgi:hypothetical protein
MHCRAWLAACGLVVATTFQGFTTLAQDASAPVEPATAEPAPLQRPADIRLGTCSSLGEVVAPLSSLIVPSGDSQGQADATPVEQSVTDVPVLLSDLLGTGHVVLVHESTDATGTPVACGEIGGALSGDGTLAVGMNPVEGSKLSGVAYFAPKRNDDGTTVTLLVVDERGTHRGDGGNGADASGAVGMAGEDGTISIGGETTTSTDNGSNGGQPSQADGGATSGKGGQKGDGTTTASPDNGDGQSDNPAPNKDKATAERDANGNAGTANTTTGTADGKGNRGGGAGGGGHAGEDGTANG